MRCVHVSGGAYSPALDLTKVFHLSDLDPVKGGPRFPRETVIDLRILRVGKWKPCRRRSHVSFEESVGCGVVSLWLPASKNDTKGNGLLRRQGCAGSVDSIRCPVKAAKRIYERGTSCGAQDNYPYLSTEDPKVAPTKPTMMLKLSGWWQRLCAGKKKKPRP